MKKLAIEEISAPKVRYCQQLEDLRWKLKSDNIRIRDGHSCRICGAKNVQLDVHHIRYIDNRQAWDYDDGDLITLCHECHEKVHDYHLYYESFPCLVVGSLFYHKGFDGVGIVEKQYDNHIWFDVCWTETEANDGENHGRLWIGGDAYRGEVRPATPSEIWDFWSKAGKYCSDFEIAYYLGTHLNKVPLDHSFYERAKRIESDKENILTEDKESRSINK